MIVSKILPCYGINNIEGYRKSGDISELLSYFD